MHRFKQSMIFLSLTIARSRNSLPDKNNYFYYADELKLLFLYRLEFLGLVFKEKNMEKEKAIGADLNQHIKK